MKVNIYFAGDSSVGIFPISIDIDLGIEIEDEDREWIRKSLTECFNEIYDNSVKVMFQDEIDNMNAFWHD